MKKNFLYHEEEKPVDAIDFNRISMLYWILWFQSESSVHQQQIIKDKIGKNPHSAPVYCFGCNSMNWIHSFLTLYLMMLMLISLYLTSRLFVSNVIAIFITRRRLIGLPSFYSSSYHNKNHYLSSYQSLSWTNCYKFLLCHTLVCCITKLLHT